MGTPSMKTCRATNSGIEITAALCEFAVEVPAKNKMLGHSTEEFFMPRIITCVLMFARNAIALGGPASRPVRPVFFRQPAAPESYLHKNTAQLLHFLLHNAAEHQLAIVYGDWTGDLAELAQFAGIELIGPQPVA
jgi:hypothetical protein